MAVLRWPGWLGCAGTLSLWTALICADAEGLPWQPDLLLLLLPSQSQERVLITGAILLCLSAGQKLLVSTWPQDKTSEHGLQGP